MEVLRNKEEMTVCPFNPAHHILKKRFQTHLTKCRLNYPDTKLVECDFNPNHLIQEPELQYHHETCPDRRKVEYTYIPEERPTFNKFPVQNLAVSGEESWDYMDVPAYNPKDYSETNEVLRKKDVAPPSVRKNFRVEEKHRLLQLSNNKPVPSSTARAAPTKPSLGQPEVKRNLSKKPSSRVMEDTPQSVADILNRINIGKDKVFIAK